MRRFLWPACLLLGGMFFAALGHGPQPAESAIFTAAVDGISPLSDGVHERDITVCFAGDAVGARPDRVEEVVNQIRRFEQVANIRFYTVTSNQRLRDALDTNPTALNCPEQPTEQPNGFDSYAGDIRLGLPGVTLIPGTAIDAFAHVPGYGCGQFNESMMSDPDSVSWNGERVDIFWRGGWDSMLQHKSGAWTWDSNNGTWYWKWQTRFTALGPISSGVGVATTGPNQLHLFHVDSGGNLQYRFWDADPETWNDNWIPLGSGLHFDPTSNPDAISIAPGRLDVFVRGADNHLYQFTSTDGGGTWPGRVDRGDGLTSAPAVSSWDNDNMVVFARRQDNAIWYKAWDGSSWSNWQNLGGVFSSAPDAVSWGADRIDVVAKGPGNAIHRNTWEGAGWSGWDSLGGDLASGPSISSPAAGRLDIFARHARTVPYHRGLDTGSWDGWKNIGDNRSASWANAPHEVDLPERRSCMYNFRLTDTYYLNHTLHEFGHALGLAHEHDHIDATCWDEDGTVTEGLLTPYDINSVMHYPYSDGCNAPGDKANTGFSDWDRLSLHILYPEDNRVAEFVGRTVVKEGETLELRSAWAARGANIDVVVDPNSWSWRLNGEEVSSEPSLSEVMDEPGVHALTLDYVDFLGRAYHYSGVVRVLEEDAYLRQVVTPILEQMPLLYPNHVYVPTVDYTLQPGDGSVTLHLPGGIADEPIVLYYAPLEQPNPTGRAHIGLFYELQATFLETGQPAQLLPGQQYEVAITYDEEALPAGMAEADLSLFYNEGGQWLMEPTSQVQPDANRVLASPDHFSQWGVLSARERLFLPAIARD